MRHGQSDIGQSTEVRKIQTSIKHSQPEDFVLEKSIFTNIFEKDIRRVFIYKKAERLAKAIHLITPAFVESVSLKNRIDAIAVGLIDAAILSPAIARTALSRELLALSSVLGIARTSGVLSSMNAELIAREAHMLLHEVASYEEPRLSFDETPSLSDIAKNASSREESQHDSGSPRKQPTKKTPVIHKGHIKDTEHLPGSPIKDRRDAILSVIKNKGTASIKDISTLVRGVSEKTIQRELSSLIDLGMVLKQGERRWSTYSLVFPKI
jgi:DNA-binding transcriptional ArsR family regulator